MGMEVKCCGDGWGRKPCLMGTDGDGYNFCGNGQGWFDFPLPCRSLFQAAFVLCKLESFIDHSSLIYTLKFLLNDKCLIQMDFNTKKMQFQCHNTVHSHTDTHSQLIKYRCQCQFLCLGTYRVLVTVKWRMAEHVYYLQICFGLS